jgi:transposase-like protein
VNREVHAGFCERRGARFPPATHLPSEDSARKLLYLAITRAQQKWRHTYNWSTALTAFRIHFGDRIPDNA